MSNGARFAYTIEEKAVLFDQFSKAMELAREGQRPFESVSRSQQAVIMDDSIVVQPKVTTDEAGKIFHVTGEWKTAAAAFDAGDYTHRWGLASEPAKIPMEVRPVDQRMRAVPLGEVRTAEQIVALYPRQVSPIAALGFGARFPKEQERAPHIVVWRDALGQFWYLSLDVNFGVRGRSVSVFRVDPDNGFSAGCCVLVGE